MSNEKNLSLITSRLLELRDHVDSSYLFPTPEPSARTLIKANPFAFCAAVCLDRGTKADIIWTIPYWIQQRVGHFDPQRFYKLSLEEIRELFDALPKKPRYTNAAPITFQNITRIVVEQFSGDAEAIWKDRKASEVKETFLSVYGVGNGIANLALILIESAYGVTFSDLDHTQMDIKPDVHTTLVLYRLGVAPRVDQKDAISAARVLNPSYPAQVDTALWFIGREFCRPSNPVCFQCPMHDICPKVGIVGSRLWN